jgi:hypothetical protein
MENKKYLYSRESIGNNVYRHEVTRETDSNIWIKIKNGERRISKKTYSILKKTYSQGSSFSRTLYYEETDILKELFKKSNLKRNFQHCLQKLQNCEDESIMKKIVEIMRAPNEQ